MRITFCQGVSVPCAVSTSIFMVLPSAAAFLEFKSQQLVRRSSQLHGSSQIISSTPLLLTTACTWNVSVPLENTVGAHPRGWVGPSCLCHNPRQQRVDELFRPAKTGWSATDQMMKYCFGLIYHRFDSVGANRQTPDINWLFRNVASFQL